MKDNIKILVIEDSEFIISLLSKGLSYGHNLEIVASVVDEYNARVQIAGQKPDVIILDIDNPKIDSIEFLRRLIPHNPKPVIALTSLTQKSKYKTLQALEAGAVDFVPKPGTNIENSLSEMISDLRDKIIIASAANPSVLNYRHIASVNLDTVSSRALDNSSDKIIAIGAATGGVEAVRRIILALPANMPGIVIALNVPHGFTKTFAAKLNDTSLLQVKEAETGDRILRGRVLITPGDFHLKVVPSGGLFQVECSHGLKVNNLRPSIDVLFFSIAEHVGPDGLGVILTGAGTDGINGFKSIKATGGMTLCQDETSSLVKEKPNAAFDTGSADFRANLEDIPSTLIRMLIEENK